jgi:O-antigen polymerase
LSAPSLWPGFTVRNICPSPQFAGGNIFGYAPGIFQQLNVTASFLATGLAALLYLLADTRRALYLPQAERVRFWLSASHYRDNGDAGAVPFPYWLDRRVNGILCASVMFAQARFRHRTTRWRRTLIILQPCSRWARHGDASAVGCGIAPA